MMVRDSDTISFICFDALACSSPKRLGAFHHPLLSWSHFFLMNRILLFAAFFAIALSYSVDFEDLPTFLEEDEVRDEMSRPEFVDFMSRFGNDYGYNNTIDDLRENDMKRLKGAVYLDYTGSGMYRESQVQKCANLLLNGVYGNAHSRSPSSLNTEHLVRAAPRIHHRWRTCVSAS